MQSCVLQIFPEVYFIIDVKTISRQ